MSEISKEAIDEARRLLENSHRVGASGIAAALQLHMDATARWREQYDTLDECCDAQKRRAEKAEARARSLYDDLTAMRRLLEQAEARVEAAEGAMVSAHEAIATFVTEAGGTVRIRKSAHLDAPRKRIVTSVDPLTDEFVIVVRGRKS